jgi:hypothetical protein
MLRDDRRISVGEDGMNKMDWRQLCEQASHETDSQKLLQLTAEISRLLGDEQKRSRDFSF